jgi:hypothetical protein
MAYPGGKSGPGVYHRLINLMPPHATYCEPFLGGGAVMRKKRPAAYSVGVDMDAEVIERWRSGAFGNAAASACGEGKIATPAANLVAAPELPLAAVGGGNSAARRRGKVDRPSGGPSAASGSDGGGAAAGRPRFRFVRGDGLTFLTSYLFEPADLVYCDPPYLRETRSGGRLYRHELEDWQHKELLATIVQLPCMVMISGYWSRMYADALKSWRSISYESMTRGGMATEWLWLNFPETDELHDYRFLGEGNRKRTDLKRQKERWVARLERMPALKKRALLSAIATHCGNAAGIR